MTKPKYNFSDRTKYDALMEVVQNRLTTRAFDASYVMPREHFELILDAARHALSGANAQPWHFIMITISLDHSAIIPIVPSGAHSPFSLSSFRATSVSLVR